MPTSATAGHQSAAVAFSPDGRTLAAGCYRGAFFNEDLHWCIGDLSQTVALYEAGTGRCFRVLHEVHGHGTSWGLPSTPLGQFVSFSPDGNTLAVGTWDGVVRLWAVSSGELTRELRTTTPHVRAVAFSGDGRTLVAASRSGLTFWDTAKYDVGREDFTQDWARAVAFSADSQLLAMGSDHSFRGAEVWSTRQGGLKRSIPTTDPAVRRAVFRTEWPVFGDRWQ